MGGWNPLKDPFRPIRAVGKSVDKAVTWVGDAVSDVGSAIDDYITQQILRAAEEDPLKFIAMAAVMVATSGAGSAWMGMSQSLNAVQAASAMGAISSVSALAKGEDLGDALRDGAESFAKTYAAHYVTSSFGSSGAPGGGETGTIAYGADGSSTQFFDDGSRLFTDASGAVGSVPAAEGMIMGEAAGAAATAGAFDQAIANEQALGAIEAPADAGIAPEDVPVYQAPETAYATPTADPLDAWYEMNMAGAETALPDYYGDLPAQVPVVDRSVSTGAMAETPVTAGNVGEYLWEGTKAAGSPALDYAIENPMTTLQLGALAYGAMQGGEQPQQAEEQYQPKEYKYVLPDFAPVSYADIRGPDAQVMPTLDFGYQRQETPLQQLQMQSTANQPAGISSLRQNLVQISPNQAVDISRMTPEQLIRLQTQADYVRR
jgi:hypothetical protein